jgi:hypothetical protein
VPLATRRHSGLQFDPSTRSFGGSSSAHFDIEIDAMVVRN